MVFYTEADRIAQKLTSSTLAVNSDGFFSLLDRIDECMVYILEHVSSGSILVRCHGTLVHGDGCTK